MTIALYPGSFDPVTNGHLDIITRAAAIFDQVVVGVYKTPEKNILFTPEERLNLLRQAVSHLKNVRVESYDGLTVDFCKKVGAEVMVRGLRMRSDFEREFELEIMNKKLAPNVESIFLMSRLEYQFLSSSLLKEAAKLGGDINNLVPQHVVQALKKKFKP